MATVPAIPLQPVESSRIAAIGYSEDEFVLAVRFHPTKASPGGKTYHYEGVSPELYDDFIHAESIGVFFGEHIKGLASTCVDDGVHEVAPAQVYEPSVAVPELVDIPDDEAGLKALAINTSSEATMLSVTTAAECEAASREVLRVRAQRKLAIEKVNKIKIPATQAWKAACELFNEVDGLYAQAEKYLDGGILEFRRVEKKRIADLAAAEQRRVEEERAAAYRKQQDELRRRQEEAAAEAKRKAEELAEADAQAAHAQGQPSEMVAQIRANPLPLVPQPIEVPVMEYVAPHAPIARQELPQVQGLGFTTEWLYEIVDEDAIPMSHDFYSLDPKKINARVQSLKQKANIPGVRIYSEERSIKRTGRK